MLREECSDGVTTLTFDDPARRNAFSMEMRLALLGRFRLIEADTSVRAVVLTGGPDFFCVGGDVAAMGSQAVTPALERMRIVHDLARLMTQSVKPIISAVEGWAVGGGLSLAMLCDTVVAGATARFKANFVDVGLIGDIGLLHALPARVGTGRAKQLLFYGEAFSAAEALQWGVIDRVVEAGQAGAEAARLAAVLARKAPLPLGLTKSIFNQGFDDLLAREREVQAMLLGSADHQEGKSAFFEKRAPRFQGK
jgi:enoyl-CoA hydratase/carnithine racemase